MGAKYYWVTRVETSPGSGSYTDVSNVQGISVSYGRTQPTDDFPCGQISISGILPDALPSVMKTIGTQVLLNLVAVGGGTIAQFYGNIRSLNRTYGTVPNLDTWQCQAVGSIAQLAEQQTTSAFTTTAGANTIAAASTLLTAYSISHVGSTGSSTVSGTTFAIGTYLNDIVQTLMRTEQGRLIDTVFSLPRLNSRSSAVDSFSFCYFADPTAPANAYNVPYTAVDFLNTGEYLANTVIVEPEGLADQTVGTAKPVLNFGTLDQTTSQAADLAGYIKNTLDSNTVRPLSVTVLIDAMTTNNWQYAIFPGAQVRLILRGTTYDCIVEGASFTASPSATQATFNLSSASAYSFLRLDDAVFGTLDNNKLGF